MIPGPDLAAYFARIGYRGAAGATVATLEALHALHVAAIPFENLSAFMGEPVALELRAVESKLLAPGRGGWCFEHNLFFSHVLEALGFRVTRLAARVRWKVAPGVVAPRSHMLMGVQAEGRQYVADVGFGGLTLSAPLLLEPGLVQETPHEPHRIVTPASPLGGEACPGGLEAGARGGGYILQARIAGEWRDLYSFDLHEQLPADYEAANWYLATHPGSQFVKGIVAARAAPEARHALRNTRYTIHPRGGESRRSFIGSVGEYRRVLDEAFHVRVPEGQAVDRRLAALIEANPPE